MDYLIAIATFAGLTAGCTLLLIVAERYLASYGSCKITVNGGEQEFTVKGGENLLTVLRDKQIDMQSACGGKGTCGYCKVRVVKGGGAVLPTEAVYMSRSEIKAHTRLACQVKLKEDLEIRIPDFLEIIKAMVKNKTFNTSKRWRFIVE